MESVARLHATDPSGKHSATCVGPVIKLTDLRTEPLVPVCAPIPPSTGVPVSALSSWCLAYTATAIVRLQIVDFRV